MHRRTDDHAGQIAVGNRGADRAERVTEARNDALRRVGQGAVEVEDHQLRAARHDLILPDGALCRDVASQLRTWEAPGCRRALPRRSGRGSRHARLRRQRPRRRTAVLAGRPPRHPAARARPLPQRGRRASRRSRPSPPGMVAQRRRGGAAGRRSRGVRAAGQPAAAAGRADRTVVHRARSGAGRGRRAVSPRRAGAAVRADRRPSCPTTPTSSSSATRRTRPRCCTPASRSSRCAGPAASWWSTRRSATRSPASPSRWRRDALPDVVVLRSLTKTWALAGLRVGYALGPADVLDRMTARRPHWPLGTLQLEAIAACSSPEAVAEADRAARRLARAACGDGGRR